MIEIRIHGRGGQGAVTASDVLALAAFHEGKYVQSFPKFGPERTGAPVESYCRISDEPILLRTQVYEPDYVIVLDGCLPVVVDVASGLKKGGVIVINSKSKPRIDGFRVFSVDATSISLEILGRPIVNTAMLGAFTKVTGIISLESIFSGIRERFPSDLAEKNILAVKRAYEKVA